VALYLVITAYDHHHECICVILMSSCFMTFSSVAASGLLFYEIHKKGRSRTLKELFLKEFYFIKYALIWPKVTVNAVLMNFLFIKESWRNVSSTCQQIRILEWFLKDHVRLKTGVMMLKIYLCHHRNKGHF